MEACGTSLSDFRPAQLTMNYIAFCLLFLGAMAEVSHAQESADLKIIMAELEREFRDGECNFGALGVERGAGRGRVTLISG